MSKYLFHANYSAAGNRGVIGEGGSSRQSAVQAMVESLGGSVESFYYVLGGDEAFVVCDLPSDKAATALAMTVGATGAAELRTTALLTPSDVDAAVGLAPAYRPPGA